MQSVTEIVEAEHFFFFFFLNLVLPRCFKAARQADRQDLIGWEGSTLSISGFSRSIPAASQAGKTIMLWLGFRETASPTIEGKQKQAC